MKRVLIVTLLLTSFISRGQEFLLYKESGLIKLATESYKLKALSKGVDIDSVLRNHTINGYPAYYLGIKEVENLEEGIVAMIDFTNHKNYYTARILIRKKFTKDFYVVENTIAHELGHFLQLKHTEKGSPDIMSEDQPYKKEGGRYQQLYYSMVKPYRWEIYFFKIKKAVGLI